MEAVPTSEPKPEGDYQVKPGSGKRDPLARPCRRGTWWSELPAGPVPSSEGAPPKRPPPVGSSPGCKQPLLGL